MPKHRYTSLCTCKHARRRSSPGAEGVFQDPRKLKDIERLRDKIVERSPHAIVVGTSDPSSAQLHSDIVAVCDHLLDYNIQ